VYQRVQQPVPATHRKKEGYLARCTPHQKMRFGTRVLIYASAVLEPNEKRPTHTSCVAPKHMIQSRTLFSPLAWLSFCRDVVPTLQSVRKSVEISQATRCVRHIPVILYRTMEP
jgi:hypothetical protein